MAEETNLTVEEEIETLFDEPAEEPETTEPEAEQPSEEAPPEKADQPAEEPQTYKVKYMGQEIELTHDQLIANAQKGMDYARIREERDALKNAPEMQIIQQYARQNGMTVAEYRDYLAKTAREEAVRRQVETGVPEETARQVVELREREQERTAREQAEQQKKDVLQQYKDLLEVFPEVQKMEVLPPEVVQDIESGKLPVLAYSLYRNRQLQNHLAAAEKAKENAAKTPGPVNGDAPAQDADLFDQGFNEVFGS